MVFFNEKTTIKYRLASIDIAKELLDQTTYSYNKKEHAGVFTFSDGFEKKIPMPSFNNKAVYKSSSKEDDCFVYALAISNNAARIILIPDDYNDLYIMGIRKKMYIAYEDTLDGIIAAYLIAYAYDQFEFHFYKMDKFIDADDIYTDSVIIVVGNPDYDMSNVLKQLHDECNCTCFWFDKKERPDESFMKTTCENTFSITKVIINSKMIRYHLPLLDKLIEAFKDKDNKANKDLIKKYYDLWKDPEHVDLQLDIK